MRNSNNQLQEDVIRAAREYGISTVLYRNTIGDKLGVNVTDMECLGLLFFKGISTPTELSRYTGLSSGATTAMLDRLERAGLIIRRPNPNDRRGVIIEANRASMETVGPMFSGPRAAQTELLESLSEAELETVKQFLSKLAAVWESARTDVLSQQ